MTGDRQHAVSASKVINSRPAGTEVPVYGKKERLYYIDWLRMLAVLGVFYAHAAWLFDLLYSWRIESTGNAYALVVFGNQWGLALFFMLAGASAWFSLGSRTGRQFLGERVTRLVLPFLAGVLLIAPPQAYFMDLSRSLFHGSFLQYYQQYFLQQQFSWNPQSLVGYGFHLWFLVFLFLYSLLSLPLFLFLRRARGQHFIAWLAAVGDRRGGLFLLVLPLALIQLTLRAAFPEYQGWADFVSWLVYFVYGYLLIAHVRLQQAIRRQGLLELSVGCVSLLSILLMMFGPGAVRVWQNVPGYSLAYELGQFLFSITSWSLILLALWFGMRVLNVDKAFIRYANGAIVPFYILHYLLISMLTFLVLRWEMPMAVRFVVVTTLALLMTLLVYNLFIRRIGVLRWMFGMKLPQQS
jgi:glucans biosynthesis protein C